MVSMNCRFPDLSVLAGADPLMLPLLKSGGAGCITAASNLVASALRTVWDRWQDPDQAAVIEAAQTRIIAWRNLTTTYAQIPTTKSLIGRSRRNATWDNVMPPMVNLTEGQRHDVWARSDALSDLEAVRS